MSPLNITRRTKSALIATAVAALLLGASAVAVAADAGPDQAAAASTVTGSAPHSSNSMKVSYRDLDLETANGSRTLEERITLAARKVCAAADIRNLAEVAAGEACQREAVSRALADVHNAHPSAQYAVNLTRR
jgi:UrcA family protein